MVKGGGRFLNYDDLYFLELYFLGKKDPYTGSSTPGLKDRAKNSNKKIKSLLDAISSDYEEYRKKALSADYDKRTLTLQDLKASTSKDKPGHEVNQKRRNRGSNRCKKNDANQAGLERLETATSRAMKELTYIISLSPIPLFKEGVDGDLVTEPSEKVRLWINWKKSYVKSLMLNKNANFSELMELRDLYHQVKKELNWGIQDWRGTKSQFKIYNEIYKIFISIHNIVTQGVAGFLNQETQREIDLLTEQFDRWKEDYAGSDEELTSLPWSISKIILPKTVQFYEELIRLQEKDYNIKFNHWDRIEYHLEGKVNQGKEGKWEKQPRREVSQWEERKRKKREKIRRGRSRDAKWEERYGSLFDSDDDGSVSLSSSTTKVLEEDDPSVFYPSLELLEKKLELFILDPNLLFSIEDILVLRRELNHIWANLSDIDNRLEERLRQLEGQLIYFL